MNANLIQMLFVLFVLLGATSLFVLDRFRMDLVGFGALTLLLASGILTVPEALAGFADPSVHMIAALFVVGAAVFETGLADRFGNLIERIGGNEPRRLLATILLATAFLSAFLSSTGTVALMVPVVTSLARKAQLSPSKLMIPLAFATLLGGLLTLIATAPNLVVSTALENAGYAPFSFFAFTGPGLVLTLAGIAFLVWLGPNLLPDRAPKGAAIGSRPSPDELWRRYGLEGWMGEFEVQADSPLVGQSIATSAVRTRYGVAIFGVRSGGGSSSIEVARADRVLLASDVLTVKGAPGLLEAFREQARLTQLGRPERLPDALVALELLLPPGSSLVGKSVRDARLRTRFDVTVMAVFRTHEPLRDSVANTTLHVGDLLLVLGSSRSLVKLRDELSDTIVVSESEELRKAMFRRDRAPHALVIVLAMLIALTFNFTAAVTVVVTAALLMVLVGCVDVASAERAVSWESLLLIATFLPMATALAKVGVIGAVVQGMVHALGSAGPYAIVGAMFVLTALLGTVISNTATAVLVSPIAVQVATRLGILPQPLLMAVAVAASAAFLTPVSSPVNLLVVNPGAYKFGDFAKVGAPLLLLIGLLTVVIVPVFFPFH